MLTTLTSAKEARESVHPLRNNLLFVNSFCHLHYQFNDNFINSYLLFLQNENPGPGTYKGYEQTNNDVSPSYSKRGTGTFASKVQQLLGMA